jgi:PXPV repeat (3 copies)
MKRTSKLLRMFGILTFLAVASLALPLSSHAGGVHVSIGLGLPFPVVVAPQPVVVHPAPVIVARPPVMVAGPHVVYTHPYYGGHRHWGGS